MNRVADSEAEPVAFLEACHERDSDGSECELLQSVVPAAPQLRRLGTKAVVLVTVLLGLSCLLSQRGVIVGGASLANSDHGTFQESNHIFAEAWACSYPMEGVGYAAPDMSNRRCGTCCGAQDTSSSMCHGATYDGRLWMSESVVQARCNADWACRGYVYNAWEGFYRPVTSVASVVPDSQWQTYGKMCVAKAEAAEMVLLTSAFVSKDGNQHINEIYAALNANLLNEHIAAVHVLTESDCDEIKHMLVLWAKRTVNEAQILRQMNNKLTCVETEGGAQPTYGDFFRYANKSLSHRVVLFSNGDVVFDETLGLIDPGPVKRQEHGYVLSVQSPPHSGIYKEVFHEECDLAPRCAVGNWAGGGSWGQKYAGCSWDVYVFSPPLSPKMDLGHIDKLVMNIFGAENLAGFQLEVRASINLFNPCYHVHAFHWHCQGEAMHSANVTVRADHPQWYLGATNGSAHTSDAVSDVFPCWNCPGIKMPEGSVRTEGYCLKGTILNSSQVDALERNFRVGFVNPSICCKDPSTCHTLSVERLLHCIKAEDVDCVTWEAVQPHTIY